MLTAPVTWSVAESGAVVDHVDFLIDGAVHWTEHTAPCVIKDEGQLLLPWLLPAGDHVLLAGVVHAGGRTDEAVVHVRTGPGAARPAALDGAFVRTVTPTDVTDTAHEPGREPGAALPVGTWRARLAKGLLSFDDALGSGGAEGVNATAGQLTTWAWPQWLLPSDRRGKFCKDPADLGPPSPDHAQRDARRVLTGRTARGLRRERRRKRQEHLHGCAHRLGCPQFTHASENEEFVDEGR